jgi:hypothetical protein
VKFLSKAVTIYRLSGGILVLIAIIGYMTVADELHHFGEFLGVTCILVSGLILLLIESRVNRFKNLALQWIAVSLIACIPVGGIIYDNMPLGIVTGLTAGVVLAFIFRSRKSQKQNESSHGNG